MYDSPERFRFVFFNTVANVPKKLHDFFELQPQFVIAVVISLGEIRLDSHEICTDYLRRIVFLAV